MKETKTIADLPVQEGTSQACHGTSKPAVSVLMPVYNAELYLSAAIESILGQTLSNFEFLIFDDGSTDRSLRVAERWAACDPRIAIFHGQHQGYAPLLNDGLAAARGCYCARMDADDVVSSDRLEKQVRFLEDNPECVAVGSQVVMIDEDGDPVRLARHPVTPEEIDSRHLEGRFQMTHASLLIRSDALRRIGGYRTEFEPAEDFDMLLRLGETGQLANLPDFLYHYRMHSQQVTVTKYETQQRAMRKALSDACQRRGIPQRDVQRFVHQRPEQRWQVSVSFAEAALAGGFGRTARKHARQALWRRPWSRTAWSVFVRTAMYRQEG